MNSILGNNRIGKPKSTSGPCLQTKKDVRLRELRLRQWQILNTVEVEE